MPQWIHRLELIPMRVDHVQHFGKHSVHDSMISLRAPSHGAWKIWFNKCCHCNYRKDLKKIVKRTTSVFNFKNAQITERLPLHIRHPLRCPLLLLHHPYLRNYHHLLLRLLMMLLRHHCNQNRLNI